MVDAVDIPHNVPLFLKVGDASVLAIFNTRTRCNRKVLAEDKFTYFCRCYLLAVEDNFRTWNTSFPTGLLPIKGLQWEIVVAEDLPLYLGWKYVWPLLSQMVKDS